MCEEENDLFEDDPEDRLPGIQIFRLRKVIQKRPIIKCLTLNAYVGQTTAIIGPHESGKSMLMNILRGTEYPSYGTANIDGNDIRCDRICARRCLGYAPQCNALWCVLTPIEHVYFWTRLKAKICKCKAEEEASYWVERFGLKKSAEKQAQELSYNDKRKLAIANAFCGGSKIILLDDPTSSLDPNSKKEIYNVLKEENAKRAIFLTTQLFNEAEYADRVGVMYNGEIVCIGSLQFLRDAFGGHYTLVIQLCKKACCDEIKEAVKKYVPNSEIKPLPSFEMRFYLNQEDSNYFPGLFCYLQQKSECFGIKEINLLLTPFEDIVLRPEFKRHEEKKQCEEQCEATDKCKPCSVTCYRKLKGCFLCWNRFMALLLKRLIYTWGSCCCMFLFQILLPILLVFLFTGIFLMADKDDNSTAITESPSIPPDITVPPDMVPKEQHRHRRKPPPVPQPFDPGIFERIEDNSLVMKSPNFYDTPHDDDSNNNNNNNINNPALILASAINTIFKNVFDNNITLTFLIRPLPYVYQADPAAAGGDETTQAGATSPAGNPDDVVDISTTPQPEEPPQGVEWNPLDDKKTRYALHLALAFIIMVVFFIKFYVQERANCYKLMQYNAGMNVMLFWFTNFLYDFIIYILIAIFMLLIPLLMEYEGFTHFGWLFLLIFMFGTMVLPMLYLLSLCFCASCMAYWWIILLAYFPLGMMLYVLVCTLIAIREQVLAQSLHCLFCLSPFYSLISGLAGLANTTIPKNDTNSTDNGSMSGDTTTLSPHAYHGWYSLDGDNITDSGGDNETGIAPYDVNYPGIGCNLAAWAIMTPLFFYWVIAYDMNALRGLICRRIRCRRLRPPQLVPCEDSDIFEEKKRIFKIAQPQFQKHDKAIVLKNFSKFYDKDVKFCKINLGIKRRESFGIIGVRGVGKSTLMRILVGAVKPTCGSAWVCTWDVRCNLMCIRKCIGYLPQCDFGFGCFQARELLCLFALMRGIPRCAVRTVIRKIAQDLYFTKYLKDKMKVIKAGVRRRIHLACATIGEPRILLLDEPTSGVDPVSKYYIWKYIHEIHCTGTTIVITTDSLEEAEALCTKVTILNEGQLICLGAPQYLRNKFIGECYRLQIFKCNECPIDDWVYETFPKSCLVDERDCDAIFEIPQICPLDRMFAILEKAKCEGKFMNYLLYQPGFNEVFQAVTEELEECEEECP